MSNDTQDNDNLKDSPKAISIRDVEPQTWTDFKKLAALKEMTLNDYLKHVVAKEMRHVQISE